MAHDLAWLGCRSFAMSAIVRATNCVGTTMRMTSAPSTASAMLFVALSPCGTL
jgi:hypothetical protein